MNAMLSHNESEKNSPDLPLHILHKVEKISTEMGLSDSATLPFPEPHCNCPYCQIAKSIQKNSEKKTCPLLQEESEEESITANDLAFTSWIIRPLKHNLYEVVHPDNLEEKFQVFLSSPLGCSCGSSQCEHIRAVLSS